MAETNSTVRTDINSPLEAVDALNHAYAMTVFLQDVLTLKITDEITIDSGAATGLYFIFGDIQDRIKQANLILSNECLKSAVQGASHE